MSKFIELCETFKDSRDEYIVYRDTCYNFMGTLVHKLIDSWQCPEEAITWIPVDKDIEPNTRYSIPGAMTLDEDAWWHLGLVITLYVKPNVFPQEKLLLDICLKKDEDGFILKVAGPDNEFSVHEGNDEECEAFYESVYDIIKGNYKKGLNDFLDGEIKTRKIGFQA